MAGNVNEWVMDVYRDLTFEDMDEFRPFRGNVFEDYQIIVDPRSGDMELTPEAENYFDYTGKILKKPVRDESCFNRENYTTADNRNYLDGDLESLVAEGLVTDYWVDNDRFKSQSTAKESVEILDTTMLAITNIDTLAERINERFPGATLIGENEILLANGVRINLVEKTYVLPTGHERTPEGNVVMPDGSMILENGKIQLADGSIVYPDQIFVNQTTNMYEAGTWGSDGMHEWGDADFDRSNPKHNKGENMTSLITDRSRVFKGGSWKDRAYWMVPGTRRFLDENKSRCDIGFRCAMIRIGAPTQGKK
jgi:hypothetical protein